MVGRWSLKVRILLIYIYIYISSIRWLNVKRDVAGAGVVHVVAFMLLEAREERFRGNCPILHTHACGGVIPGELGEGRCIVHVFFVVLKLHVDRCDISFCSGRASWERAIIASEGLGICSVTR